MEPDLLQKLGSKEISKVRLFGVVEADFSLIPTLLEWTSSPKAIVRYSCGSVLADLSKKYPEKLYPYMNRFIHLLESKHRILTWNALAIIANLTAVDVDRKFDTIFGKYYGYLGSGYMVTVANVVVNSAKIANSKQYLAQRITSELLKVQNLKVTPHLTEECKLVIAEQAIKTFNTIFGNVENKAQVIAFVKAHQNSPRPSLGKEAQNFLKKWQ